MIKTRKHNINRYFIIIVAIAFVACNNSKEVTNQPNNFGQERAYKLAFHEANSEKMIGHYDKAIDLFEKCLQLNEESSAAHFALSDLYESIENGDKMLYHAQLAYKYDNSNKWYALRLADIYFINQQYDKTADLYAGIIADEKNVDVKFKYTDALLRAGRTETAIQMLNEIEVETGKIPEISFTKYDLYSREGRIELAEAEMNAFLEEHKNNMDFKIMAAEFYMQNNKFEQSGKLIEEIIKADPKNGQAYIMMADIELRQDNVEAAFFNLYKGFESPEVELDRKLEIIRGLIPYSTYKHADYSEMRKGIDGLFEIIYDPELEVAKLHDYFGYYLLSCGFEKRALEEYRIASQLDKGSFNTWVQLLNLENNLKDYSSLAKNGSEAAELFPAQPVFYLFAGIGNKENEAFSEAEEWFFLGKDLVVRDPQLQSEFLYQLGDLSYRKKDVDEGEFYFKQALEIHPKNPSVFLHKTQRLLAEKDTTAAEKEVMKGVEVSPKNIKLLTLYGDILFGKKDYKKAAEKYLSALYENYYNPLILEKYGDALFLSGDKSQAIEMWNEAVEFGNDNPQLKKKIEDEMYYSPN